MTDNQKALRRDAVKIARRAVAAYARDPSKDNALLVENAMRRVRLADDIGARRQSETETAPQPEQRYA